MFFQHRVWRRRWIGGSNARTGCCVCCCDAGGGSSGLAATLQARDSVGISDDFGVEKIYQTKQKIKERRMIMFIHSFHSISFTFHFISFSHFILAFKDEEEEEEETSLKAVCATGPAASSTFASPVRADERTMRSQAKERTRELDEWEAWKEECEEEVERWERLRKVWKSEERSREKAREQWAAWEEARARQETEKKEKVEEEEQEEQEEQVD